jgi:hypothetical protein
MRGSDSALGGGWRAVRVGEDLGFGGGGNLASSGRRRESRLLGGKGLLTYPIASRVCD